MIVSSGNDEDGFSNLVEVVMNKPSRVYKPTGSARVNKPPRPSARHSGCPRYPVLTTWLPQPEEEAGLVGQLYMGIGNISEDYVVDAVKKNPTEDLQYLANNIKFPDLDYPYDVGGVIDLMVLSRNSNGTLVPVVVELKCTGNGIPHHPNYVAQSAAYGAWLGIPFSLAYTARTVANAGKLIFNTIYYDNAYGSKGYGLQKQSARNIIMANMMFKHGVIFGEPAKKVMCNALYCPFKKECHGELSGNGKPKTFPKKIKFASPDLAAELEAETETHLLEFFSPEHTQYRREIFVQIHGNKFPGLIDMEWE